MARYDVKDINGNELKDLEEDAVASLVNKDLLTATCPMKKSIMREWKTAQKFEFLTNPLSEQNSRFAAAAMENGDSSGDASRQELAKSEALKYRAVPAPLEERKKAFLYDFLRSLAKLIPLLVIAVLVIYLLPAFTMNNMPTPSFPVSENTAKKKMKSVENPTSFVQMDELNGYAFGMKFIDEQSKQEYVCLSSLNGHAVWCKTSFPVSVIAIAVAVFLFWEFLSLVYPLCIKKQTPGMEENELLLQNSKDVRVELAALQAFGYLFLIVVLLPINWIVTLIAKKNLAELATLSTCSVLPDK